MKRAVPYLRVRRRTKPRPTRSANSGKSPNGPAGRSWMFARITELAALRAETSDRLSTGCIKRPHNANSMWSWPGRLIG